MGLKYLAGTPAITRLHASLDRRLEQAAAGMMSVPPDMSEFLEDGPDGGP